MRIQFEVLRDKGYEVDVDRDGVTIRGTAPFTSLSAVIDELHRNGIGRIEAEVLTDEFFGKIEGRMILAALE